MANLSITSHDTTCSSHVLHHRWLLFLLMKPYLEMKQFSKALSLEMASGVRDMELQHIEEVKGDSKY